MKTYTVKYDMHYECILHVDPKIFTPEVAKSLLEFFIWDYDKEACPILEYTKKIAARVFSLSHTMHEAQILEWFEEAEGHPDLEGKHGIKLHYYDELEIDFEDMHVKIS